MAQSMTGFGSAEESRCRVEIRSLNQRFLDISIKSPSFLNQHEMTFRNILRERFNRGKFDVSISVSGDATADLKLNKEVAGRIFSALRSLQEEFAIPGQVDINSIANFHDMFMVADISFDIETIKNVFEEAVENLYHMRSREGQLLVREIGSIVDVLGAMNSEMRTRSAQAAPEAAARLKERMTALFENREIDPVRMHQEIAILASKADITEEIARFDSHIQQFREVLGSDGIVGRKLDFLVQELNREVNTMSAKSVDFNVSKLAVDMKTEIEKIREQAQNLQ
jgi:uncharacterized protein (TIGR00255 family)